MNKRKKAAIHKHRAKKQREHARDQGIDTSVGPMWRMMSTDRVRKPAPAVSAPPAPAPATRKRRAEPKGSAEAAG